MDFTFTIPQHPSWGLVGVLNLMSLRCPKYKGSGKAAEDLQAYSLSHVNLMMEHWEINLNGILPQVFDQIILLRDSKEIDIHFKFSLPYKLWQQFPKLEASP
jgi:hypothetical protein